MTYAQIYNAFGAIRSLSSQKLKVKQSYKLFDFSKKLDEHYRFFQAEMRKIMQRHGVTLTENNTFKGSGDQTEFEKDMHELEIAEIDDLEELELAVPEDIVLSRDDIELLSGVIKLVFEDDTPPKAQEKHNTEGAKE